jgi:PAS domain S-box-containing protein
MVDIKILKEFNLKVLYVEDDERLRETTQVGIQLGIDDIYVAKDGLEALELYKQNKRHIDLIVSDINMPNLNGIELVRQIRQITPAIPVIFTSAHNDSENLLEAINLGVNAFVQKPLDIMVLLQKIAQVMMPVFQEKELQAKQEIINNQLAELEKFKEMVNEHSIVLKTDPEGKILSVNDKFCQISGFDQEEILAHGTKLFRHPNNTKYFFSNMWKTILDKQTWNGVIKNRTKEGKDFYMTYSIFPMLDEHKNIKEFYGIGSDITHEKEYGVKMRQLHKELLNETHHTGNIEQENQHYKQKIAVLEQKISSIIAHAKSMESSLKKVIEEQEETIGKQTKKIEMQNRSIMAMGEKFENIKQDYILTKK